MISFISFNNVYKRYKMGEVIITAADGISFEANQGEQEKVQFLIF